MEPGLRAGDLVEVRSREEILATLDNDGRLEGLPFMPQMLEYCGRRFKVLASAHKTCDVIAGEGRRLVGCVHLDVRCDGKAYGGCQAACLIFWKEAWLKRLDGPAMLRDPVMAASLTPRLSRLPRSSGARQPHRWGLGRAALHVPGHPGAGLHAASRVVGSSSIHRGLAFRQRHARASDARPSLPDLQPRDASPEAGWVVQVAGSTMRFSGESEASRSRSSRETLPPGMPEPTDDLNLQPGELVRVKDHDAILATLSGTTNRVSSSTRRWCLSAGERFESGRASTCSSTSGPEDSGP